MQSDRLDALLRYAVAFDLETHMSQPGLAIPPVVCGSAAMVSNGAITGRLLSLADALQFFEAILADPNLTLTGANIAYDVACMIVEFAKLGVDILPLVFNMYDPDRTAVTGKVRGRVLCVQVWEALHAIGKGHLGIDPRTGKKIVNPETGKQGRYSLAAVVDLVLGRSNAKVNDVWRKSFALLQHVPMQLWPIEARTYPVDDAVNTLESALAQAGHLDNIGMHEFVQSPGMGGQLHCCQCGALPGQIASCRSRWRRWNAHEVSRQTYSAFSLHMGAAYGFAIDQNAVDRLEREYVDSHAGRLQPFIAAGIVRADGSENQSVLKKLVVEAYVRGTGKPLESCTTCVGTGKVPSPTTNGRTKINCSDCDGSGYFLPPEVPRTDAARIGIGADVLIESGSELLIAYADYNKEQKIPEDYIPFFRQVDKQGVPHVGVPLTLRSNVLLENGRVSYDGKIMMLPRHGKVRQCIVARPGRLLSTQDYEGSELIGHAQSCIWIVKASRLAELLNNGLNAHLFLASQILAIPYEVALKRYKSNEQLVIDIRQICKPGNFGFMGRMGAATMVKQQRKQNDVHTPHPDGPTWITVREDGEEKRVRGFSGLRFCIYMHRADYCGITKVTQWKGRDYPPLCKACIEVCEDLRKSWLSAYPENVAYFEFVKRVDESGMPVKQHVSERLRGFRSGLVDDSGEPINSGNAIANTYFSAMIADAAKNALNAITRECYDKTHRVRSFTSYTSKFENMESPLYGSRIPSFQHDETIGDHPESIAAEAATRQAEIMEESLRIMCPDMHRAVRVQPTLMRRWYKGAQPVYDKSGRLIPDPKADFV